MKPLGVVDVHVKVGDVSFTEKAMVCEHLPGKADVLVSYDTLQEKGLQISKQGVVLGGQKCKVVVAAAPLKKPASGQKAEEQRKARKSGAEDAARERRGVCKAGSQGKDRKGANSAKR